MHDNLVLLCRPHTANIYFVSAPKTGERGKWSISLFINICDQAILVLMHNTSKKKKDTYLQAWPKHPGILSTLSSFFKLPLLSTHGALLLDLLGVEPLQDAVHMETVGALAPDQWAVISRHLTCKTGSNICSLVNSGLMTESWALRIVQIWKFDNPKWRNTGRPALQTFTRLVP